MLIGAQAAIAAKAVWAFTVALATNPIGLLAVSLSVAITALAVFGSKMVEIGGTTASVLDFVKATWEATGGALLQGAQTLWAAMSDPVSAFGEGAGRVFLSVAAVAETAVNWIGRLWATTINTLIGLWVGYGRSVSVVLTGLVDGFRAAFDRIKNLAVTFWQGLQAVFTGDFSFAAFQAVVAEQMEKPLRVAAKQVREEFKAALSTEYVQDFAEGVGNALDTLGQKIKTGAEANRKAREAAETLAAANAKLKPPIDATGDATGKADKAAKKLADTYANLAASLQKQIALFGATGQAAELRYDLEHSALKDLEPEQKKHLQRLTEELDLLTERQRLNEEGKRLTETLRTPAEQYAAELARLQTLHQEGAITQETYNRALAQAREELERTAAAADPMAQVFKDVATGIHQAFADLFQGIFDKGVDSFKDLGASLLALFKRILAQLATLALARPILVPIITGLGGMLGVSPGGQAALAQQLGVGPLPTGPGGWAASSRPSPDPGSAIPFRTSAVTPCT